MFSSTLDNFGCALPSLSSFLRSYPLCLAKVVPYRPLWCSVQFFGAISPMPCLISSIAVSSSSLLFSSTESNPLLIPSVTFSLISYLLVFIPKTSIWFFLKKLLSIALPMEKERETHSGILTWRIPWTEEPGGLQSMGLQMVRHDWAAKHAWLLLTCLFSSLCSGAYRTVIVTVLCPFLLILSSVSMLVQFWLLAFSPHCEHYFLVLAHWAILVETRHCDFCLVQWILFCSYRYPWALLCAMA